MNNSHFTDKPDEAFPALEYFVGKQEVADDISQNTAGLVPAAIRQRLSAELLDFLILIVFVSPCASILASLVHNSAVSFLTLPVYLIVQMQHGQTLGSQLVKLRYVDAEGNLPTWKAGLLWGLSHYLGILLFFWSLDKSSDLKAAIFVVLLLANLWPLFDWQRQTLHDKIASIYPVDITAGSSSKIASMPPELFNQSASPNDKVSGFVPAEFLPKATGLQVLLADFVDFIVFVGLCGVAWLICSGLINSLRTSVPYYGYSYVNIAIEQNMIVVGGVVAVIVITGGYFLVCVANGQTLGNYITETKFVDAMGQKPGYGKSGIRLMALFASITVPPLFYTYKASFGNFQIFWLGLDLSMWGLVYCWLFIASGWALVDRNKQTLFDKVADVYLVKTSPNK